MCILEAVERDVQLVHLAPAGRHVYRKTESAYLKSEMSQRGTSDLLKNCPVLTRKAERLKKPEPISKRQLR